MTDNDLLLKIEQSLAVLTLIVFIIGGGVMVFLGLILDELRKS